jgi:hypothetical protein
MLHSLFGCCAVLVVFGVIKCILMVAIIGV